jgi:CRISPR/Cas system-associated protein Cas10 (large subunit of type III CRISPR-Cas system)
VADETHEERVRRAIAELRRKRAQLDHPRPAVIVRKEPVKPRVRVPLEIPDHRCAICGQTPQSGVSLPLDTVVYFCAEHLAIGRRIAEKAWKYYKRRKKLEEMLRARKEYLEGLLDRASAQRTCPFCGQELVEELAHNGKTVRFCPSCDTEFYDTNGEVD